MADEISEDAVTRLRELESDIRVAMLTTSGWSFAQPARGQGMMHAEDEASVCVPKQKLGNECRTRV